MKSRTRLLKECLRIRMVEEEIIRLYPSDLIQSPVHLSIGQEAVAVGVSSCLRSDDWIFINYRGHAFYLARGGALPAFFAELMGKVGGVSKGKAGSMHLAAPNVGIIGASALVGSSISHAVGSALASRLKNERDRVFLVNFGDGAMEQGTFYESLNFASLHSLPVIFLLEDNGLAVHSSKNERQSFDLRALISSFGIPYINIEDGYDPEKVMNTCSPAIENCRLLQRPVFIRVRTMRYLEHVGPGDDYNVGYRNLEQINMWKSKDPIIVERSAIEHSIVEITEEIQTAVEFALRSPVPSEAELLTDVI